MSPTPALAALVVDADAACCRQVEAALHGRGYDVVCAHDEESALRAWFQRPFRLVMVDPAIRGVDLCRRLRADPRSAGTKILVCGRRCGPEELETLLEAGADDYVAKPFHLESLLARLVLLERQLRRGHDAAPGPPPDEAATPTGGVPEPPQAVAGRYEVGRLIGRGGTAEVYEARDVQLRQQVALKLFWPAISCDAVWQERVRGEITLGRSIKHPNVCMVYDIGRHQDRLFLTMELLQGTSLADVARERGPLTEHEALSLVLPAVEGMAAAHRLGIVHRDLKPSNLMRLRDGRTMVLDFGLAHRATDAIVARRGQVTGTPAYMAPEQIRDAAVGPAADVWALGCVIYFLLTGSVPLPSSTSVGTLARTLYDSPAPLVVRRPGVSPELGAIVDRCLRKSPEERFPDADGLLSELRAHGQDSRSRPAPARGPVLLAEPDPRVARGIEMALESRGFRVRRFSDGYKLVAGALDEGAQAVIANADLPVLGGIQALQILRSYPQTASVPAALISRRDDHRLLNDMMGLRARILAAPIDDVKLGCCLQELGLGAARRDAVV